MKKLLVSAGCALFLLAGCSSNTETPTSVVNPTQVATASPAKDTKELSVESIRKDLGDFKQIVVDKGYVVLRDSQSEKVSEAKFADEFLRYSSDIYDNYPDAKSVSYSLEGGDGNGLYAVWYRSDYESASGYPDSIKSLEDIGALVSTF